MIYATLSPVVRTNAMLFLLMSDEEIAGLTTFS
jgi:hypothetical protein